MSIRKVVKIDEKYSIEYKEDGSEFKVAISSFYLLILVLFINFDNK